MANNLAKYDNLAKTLSHRAYMATWKRAWQILSLLACWVLTTKIKSSPCLHAVYCLFCCQVRNNKLLEIELFFTWQIVLRIDKSQDLPNRIWPNSCKYMYVMSRFWLLFSSLEIGFRTDTILHFLRGIISHQTTHKKK